MSLGLAIAARGKAQYSTGHRTRARRSLRDSGREGTIAVRGGAAGFGAPALVPTVAISKPETPRFAQFCAWIKNLSRPCEMGHGQTIDHQERNMHPNTTKSLLSPFGRLPGAPEVHCCARGMLHYAAWMMAACRHAGMPFRHAVTAILA